MVEVPSTVAHYHVYEYQHIDDLSFIRPARKVDRTSPYAGGLAMLEEDVGRLFRANGWEGDGDIGILWIPPFLGPWGSAGLLVWHVKQDNNGTSFIASDQALATTGLGDEPEVSWREGWIPEGIMRGSRESLEEDVGEILKDLEHDLASLKFLPKDSKVRGHLTERAQGQMVQALMGFLDDCYLRILIEVVRDGNKSGVKLRRAKASLNPASYVPEDFEGDDGGFFTLNGFISDLWANYKFEPFLTKVEMLLKPIDLAPDPNLMFELRKHVALRNAVQHHEGWLGGDLLSALGRTDIPIVGPAGPERLKTRSQIAFPVEEIRALDDKLREFARVIDVHVEGRIAARMYARPPIDTP